MKKYYLMAIEFNHTGAMNNLGHYFHHTEKNCDLAKQYYLMAINENDDNAKYNLGYYYETIERNYDQMKKYYRMAIEAKSIGACIPWQAILIALRRTIS